MPCLRIPGWLYTQLEELKRELGARTIVEVIEKLIAERERAVRLSLALERIQTLSKEALGYRVVKVV